MLLLDTHVWVWSVEGNAQRIGREARRLLSCAELRDRVRVSPLSLFEVTALHLAGRLQFSRPLDQWISGALGAGIRMADLSSAVAIEAGYISRTVLADPMDRLLVATARQLDATFLTADERILEYAALSEGVRVHDANR